MTTWRLPLLLLGLLFTLAFALLYGWPAVFGPLPQLLTEHKDLLDVLLTVTGLVTVVLGVLAWLGTRVFGRLPPIGARGRYLRWLLDRHQYLGLKGMGVTDKVALKLPLRDLYIPLHARMDRPEGEAWARNLELAGRTLEQTEAVDGQRLGDREPVLDLLADNNGLVLLGDPGAGKTTFVRWLAVSIAGGQREGLGDLAWRLPILVPLSAYSKVLRERDQPLAEFIVDWFRGREADLDLGRLLPAALSAGRALLLLDGLDEVPEPGLRHTVVERVGDFYSAHRDGNKFVISSRIIGYREAPFIADGVVEATLVDLDDDEIGVFIDKWSRAFECQAQGDTRSARQDAERERYDLHAAVQGNSGVRRLAANPLMLTILALMKRQKVSLPERRVELYDSYVDTLLSTWNRVRGLEARPGPVLGQQDVVEIKKMLARLALWMHQYSDGLGVVQLDELRKHLVLMYAGKGLADDDAKAAAVAFLADVRKFSGLLVERGAGEYGFIHLTFEEFLAAMAIADRGQANVDTIASTLAGYVGVPAWREVVLLTIAYLGLVQRLDEVAGQVLATLVGERPGPAGEAVVLAGEALVDLGAGRGAGQDRRVVEAALVEVMQDGAIGKALRRRAGLALGLIGWRPTDLDWFMPVAAGEFLYGEEKEVRRIEQGYWVAKYPVTNGQYRGFVEAGGYRQRRWWDEAGWEWLQADKVDSPRYWHDANYNNPLSPVVGVNPWEARAYCRWLAVRLQEAGFETPTGRIAMPAGHGVGLPNELQWVRAARGVDGRDYPWGGAFDAALANTEEDEVIGATAVCSYPGGASPVGAWDMAGNVWELTDSVEGSSVVWRGGSWADDDRGARCAARDGLLPEIRFSNWGFRVFVSLANAGF